jgi:hypothetical protein
MPIEKQLQLLIPLIYDTTTSADALPDLLRALQRLFRARACGVATLTFSIGKAYWMRAVVTILNT